jgi:flavin reductase (DIM6/NTAB) family NADH-FMN oxidoreductase RutF
MKALLPEALKRRLRPLPQWSAVGVSQPQALVEVRLSVAGAHVELGSRLVVASLRPLILALGLHEAPPVTLASGVAARVEMIDRDSQRCVGTLDLRCIEPDRRLGTRLAFFEVTRQTQHCLDWPHRVWNGWWQARAQRRPAQAGNFSMPPAAVLQMMVFYLCPRPVVLVSVAHGAHCNLFPMDLMGPLGSRRWSLALRSTSASIDAMLASGHVALADVPVAKVRTAYALGVQHRASLTDWSKLALPLIRSPLFDLPVPAFALRVRELEILDSEPVGSHHLFVTRVVAEEVRLPGAQLCHVPGIYQRFRERTGRALSVATPG